MDERRVRSFTEFHDAITRHQGEWWRWYYRGHSRPDYKLIPKIGREVFQAKGVDEKRLLDSWRLHAVAFMTASPQEFSEWDFVAIAQHHGLATRLLDWTFNALIAAFFAVVDFSENRIIEDCDAIVYAHYSEQPLVDVRKVRLFDFKGIGRVAPSSVTPRIGRQGGIFTVHGPPTLNLESDLPQGDKLEKVIIDRSCRKDFAIQLSHYGMNRMSLFPDLDGLSGHINWSFTHLPYK